MASPRPASNDWLWRSIKLHAQGEVAGNLRQLFVGRSAPGQPRCCRGGANRSHHAGDATASFARSRSTLRRSRCTSRPS